METEPGPRSTGVNAADASSTNETATEFDVPMYFVQGAHEAVGRARVFEEWYPMIDAPAKDLVVFDTSGHRPLWEQPDEFVDYTATTVPAETSDR